MNSLQAKSILQLYRADCDEVTPEVSAALAQLDHDPQLKFWYTQQLKNEQRISHEISNIKVPSAARHQLQHDLHAKQHKLSSRKFLPIGLAAAIMFAIYALFATFQPPENTFSAFRHEMISTITAEYQLNITATDLVQVRNGFKKMGWPSDYVEPASFRLLHTVGGMALTWQENKVSTLCLETDAGEYFWLFMINNSAFDELPPSSENKFMSVGNLITTNWSETGMTYFLVAEGGYDLIEQYL